MRLWLDSECWADGVVAKQPAKAAFGWVGTARHLFNMAVFDSRDRIRCDPSSATGGLGAPAASLIPFVMGPSADVISRRI